MIVAICLLVPPLLLVYMREKVFQNHKNIYKSALSYAFFTLFLNSGIMLIRYAVSGISGNLFSQLNNYSAFACKYTILSVALALVEPYAEKFIRERVRWEVRLPRACLAFPYWRAAAVVYAAILFFLNFIRIFDNNFWEDEAFTTNLMTGTVSEIIATTAADVHPPLYYLIVKLGYALVGNRGWMFHLASLIPCAVILAFSLTAVWDRFGKETAIILMTLTTISGNAVTYNMEVRMYSWGALFILLSFYYLYLILTEGKAAHYVLFVVFSVAAAYTHYYCLLAVAFFYAALLFLSVFRKRLGLKKVLLTCACAVAAYLPWIAVFSIQC
ncbi:MAG: glycosyltransferase family 39 protein [Oscillospiraceae bacterium]|nr:glycosyltransferase family 39 protein [Oscillospiraceae bacterium]